MSYRFIILSTFLVLSLIFFKPNHALANKPKVEIGTLTCNVEGGVGFVFGSTKDLKCIFDPIGKNNNSIYRGTIEKFGIDLGATEKTTIVWAVLAPTVDISPAMLDGTYVGVSAETSIGVGAGAKLLVGGSNDTISLQPLSMQVQSGVNMAVAVAKLNLKVVKAAASRETNPVPRYVYKFCGTEISIAEGDSLHDVAGRCGTTVDSLLSANSNIKNVRDIRAGQKIFIPEYTSRQAGCGSHAIAKKDETLFHIAKRCKVSIGALIDVNPNVMILDTLEIGRTINVPPYPVTSTRRYCGKVVRLHGVEGFFSSLADIAEQCNTTLDALLEANPKVKNVRNVPKGTLINLPSFHAPIARYGCGFNVIAKKGDTLSSIALKCGTTVGALIDANPKVELNKPIKVGRVIDIPAYSIPVTKRF